MRPIFLFALLVTLSSPAKAAEPCQSIHGRARLYSADGQFRIWHIGTHHEFRPDDTRAPDTEDFSPSWDKIMDKLTANGKRPHGYDEFDIFADFIVCPTEPFRDGAAQLATVQSMTHVLLVKRTN